MKKIVLLIIQSLIFILLHSQVNFDLDFSFNKIDPSDELSNIQLFDYNQNGSDELCVGYDGDSNWEIVVYDLIGDTLSTFSQTKFENESFKQFHISKIGDTALLITASILDGIWYEVNDSLLIQVIDLENSNIISSIKFGYEYDNDNDWLDIHNINTITMQQLVENQYIYVGYNYEHGELGFQKEKSDLLKFQYTNSSLTYIETISKAGLSIEYFDDINKYISIGEYINNQDFYSVKNYYLKLFDPIVNPSVNTLLNFSGSAGFDIVSGQYYFNSWPMCLKTLTVNNENFTNLGSIYHFKEYSYDPSSNEEETNLFFISFSPDFSFIEWEVSNCNVGASDITTSTCISINSQDQYIMYFFEDQLEIRNRVNGNIVHNQNTAISPISILRNTDGDLLFIAEDEEDESTYNVYNLDGEIQVFADNDHINSLSNNLLNYPNPFNPSTTIKFSINKISNVKVSIYNTKGQKIITLVNSEFAQGDHLINWDGLDENDKIVSSGIYYYKLNVNGKITAVNKCLLLK